MVFFILLPQLVQAHGPEKHDRGQSAQIATMPETSTSSSPSESEEGAHDANQVLLNGSVLTRLHPATVHFPIALLLMAALTELFAMARPSPTLQGAVHVMLWGGAIGAIIAAIFGWVHTGVWFGGGATMQWHRWTGTGLAMLALLAAISAGRGHTVVLRTLLFLCAAIVLAQGYLGAELAHGPHHLGI